MRRTRFDRAPGPIARTTDLVGDGWTPILLRNAKPRSAARAGR